MTTDTTLLYSGRLTSPRAVKGCPPGRVRIERTAELARPCWSEAVTTTRLVGGAEACFAAPGYKTAPPGEELVQHTDTLNCTAGPDQILQLGVEAVAGSTGTSRGYGGQTRMGKKFVNLMTGKSSKL